MDSKPFLQIYRETSERVVALLDSLSALSAAAQVDLHEHDERTLLRAVLRTLIEYQPVERCSLLLLRDDLLVNASGVDWRDMDAAPSAATGAVFRLGEGLAGRAAQTGTIEYCKDCSSDPRLVIKRDAAVTLASGSLMCLPVKASDSVLGVLCAYHSEPDHFDYNHESFLTLFADFVGRTLVTARHLQRLERDIQQRTRQLEEALHKTAELKDRFEQLAIIDELTQLHNRRFFFPEAEAALARALRHERPFSVMILDLDHFKRVNDRYGHAVGDRILQITGPLLKEQVRIGDILARFGGEEFVFALPETDATGATMLAERILTELRTHDWDLDGEQALVTASIGIGVWDGAAADSQDELLERLLREADGALYASKAAGRDRYTLYEPHMELERELIPGQ